MRTSLVAAHFPCAISGTVTHAEATTAPTPITAALASRRARFVKQRNGRIARGMSARYPVSKWNAIVTATKNTAGSTARREVIARHVNAHAKGKAHDAHSCAHTP